MQSSFLYRWIGRWIGSAPPRPARLPDGLRIYAIGDIHGYSSLLDSLASRIEDDLRGHALREVLTVFLGDYVDRGPDSAGVIERLAKGHFPTPFVTLRGNHEDLMMRALADADEMDAWCSCGGLETIASYGVDVAAGLRRKGLRKVRKDLREAFPERHDAFLASTRWSFTAGDYFFVHAGARPGVALDQQAEADLLWIRQEFSGVDYDFGKVVVHGHTPHRKPENLARRINVDTGAFKTGVLTCVVLQGSERRFLSTDS